MFFKYSTHIANVSFLAPSKKDIYSGEKYEIIDNNIIATKIITTVLENISHALLGLSSPKYLPAITADPLANINITPQTTVMKGIIRFTEASGIAPTKFPINIPSTTIADEIAIIPNTDGKAKRKNSRLALSLIIL